MNVGQQIKSAAQLPGAWKNLADSRYNDYAVKKKLQVSLNKHNPNYGKKKFNSTQYERSRKKVFGIK